MNVDERLPPPCNAATLTGKCMMAFVAELSELVVFDKAIHHSCRLGSDDTSDDFESGKPYGTREDPTSPGTHCDI